MKHISFLLLSVLFCFLSSAQTLNGIVTRMNSGKTGVPGAGITSLGANPAISESSGAFQLIYQYKKTGMGVALQIEKKGFEVVNKDALFTYLGNQYDTLKIYLCHTGELDSLRIKYYDISVKNIKKRYAQEIKKLSAQHQEDRNQIAVLDQQLKAAISQAADLAQRFSVINLDDCSELFRNAFNLFEQGKIEEAINALPDAVIEAQINAAYLQIEEAGIMDSIAREKKGNAQEVIRLIQAGQNLTQVVMDSLQNQTSLFLSKESPGLHALIHHADILFCLREWDNAEVLYGKILSNMPGSKHRHIYKERLIHCQQARLKK